MTRLGRLRRLGAIYRAKFATELAVQFAYRGALVIWLLGFLLEPTIYLVVWTTVADSQGGAVGGFTAGEFAGYFIVLMIVNQLTFDWHAFFMEWRVRTGDLSPMLLRPVHPIHNDVAENLTFKALTFVVLGPAAVILAIAFDAVIEPQPWQVVAFVPALIGAMLLRFLLEWSVGIAAFWVTKMGAITQAWYVSVLFLSGQVAPLSLFPQPIQVIASVLPFRWMVSFPVELGLGRLGPQDVAIGFAMQILWVGIALGILRLAWPRGIRRYGAVGA
jgi:ABC-2 type transport system permease protein